MNIGLSWLRPIPIGTDSWLVFAVVLIALVIFIWLVARLVTRMTEDSDPAETDRQMLTAINDLHRKGDLSQEEFRSIKGQLIDRLQSDQRSSADGSSDQEGCADSADPVVSGTAQASINNQETIVDTATRSDLAVLSESEHAEDEDDKRDSGTD